MSENSKPKKPIVSVCISILVSVAFLTIAYFYLRYVFHNDSNAEKSDYVEQGIVILVAVSSACISFISNRMTSYNNDVNKYEQIERENSLRETLNKREDEIRKKQEEFESKWNQAKIDADIISKARIAWIENVRHATSQFIASCYGLIRIIDLDFGNEMNSKHLTAKENGLLLMLYFGPDSQSNDDTTSNSGKNNEIYKLISKSLKLVEKLYSKKKSEELKNEIIECQESLENQFDALHLDHIEEHQIVEEDGTVNYIPEYVPDESSAEYSEYHQEKIQYDRFRYENSPRKLERLLDELTDEIRKYLKIEWDVAKKGK